MIIQVEGPALLYVSAANLEGAIPSVDLTGWTQLGVTESGVNVSISNLTHRVNSDDCGGSEGNPAEILSMGSQATIRGSLVKYNANAVSSIMSGFYGDAEGSTVLPGTPVFASGRGFSLYISGYAVTYYFPKCEFASQPREFNLSTTEKKTSFGITAYPVMCGNNLYLYGKTSNGSGAITPCAPDAYGGSWSGT